MSNHSESILTGAIALPSHYSTENAIAPHSHHFTENAIALSTPKQEENQLVYNKNTVNTWSTHQCFYNVTTAIKAMPKFCLAEINDNHEVCKCGNLMKLENKFEFSRPDVPSWVGESYILKKIFKTFSCLACRNITILVYERVILLVAQEDEEEIYDDYENVYIRIVIYSPTSKRHNTIPQAVQDVVSQAEAVISNSPRASFILCRAVLEEICNDFSIPTEQQNSKGRSQFISLHNRLSQLFSKEKLPEKLQDIIRNIKDFGNEGAHSNHLQFSEKVTIEDATNLVMLIEYVLERLYVDRYRQQEAEKMLDTLKTRVLPNQE